MAVIATLAVRLQAQIAEFQSEFRAATKTTEQFQKDFEGTATKATATGALIAGGLVLAAREIGQFGKAVLENASHIEDLAAKTGLSMRKIQEFQSVAAETGTTVDAFTDAVFRLGAKLAGDNASVEASVKRLGLSLEDLRRLTPDQQFDAVVGALGRMKDAGDRTREGLILFDRTFKGIATSVGEGYATLAGKAKGASDDQLAALGRLDDAWARFQVQALGRATAFAGGVILRFEEVEKAIDGLGQRFGGLRSLMPGNTGALVEYANELIRIRQEANNMDLSNVVSEMQKVALSGGFGGPGLAVPSGPTMLTVGTADYKAVEDALNDSIKRRNAAWKSAGAAVDDHKAKLKELAEEIKRSDLKSLVDDIKLVDEHTQDAAKAFDEAAARAREMGDDLQSLRDDVRDVDERMATFAEEMEKRFKAEDLQSLKDDIAAVAKVIETPPDMAKWEQRFETLKGSLIDIGLDAAHGFATALAEGIRTGDWSNLGVALEEVFSEALASGMAAAVDFFVPGLGQALKPLFKAISEKIAGLFDFNEGRDKVEDFVTRTFGSFDALQARLETLGDPELAARLWRNLTQGVGRDNPEQAQAAIDAVTAALERQQEAFIELGRKIGDLAVTATGSGELLDQSMIPFINQLLTAGVITDDLAAKLLLMTSENSANWREMEALAKKYGIELSGLGATFQQQKLTDTAAEIIRDFDRLINNGADFNAVLQGMSDEINDVVIESLKFGTEIPENMRPWIQALIDSGRLLDDTGAKITDIDKLKFGPAVKSDIDELTEAIRDLIKALGVTLPAAARDGAAGLQREFDGIKIAPIRVPVEFDVGKLQLPEGWNVPAMQHGGIVRRPTLALIGEAGPEAVVPLSQLASVRAAAGGYVTNKFIITIEAMDGTSVQRVVESESFATTLKRVAKLNLHDVGTTLREVTAA